MCHPKRNIKVFCQKRKINFIVMNDLISSMFMKLKCEHESGKEFYSG